MEGPCAPAGWEGVGPGSPPYCMFFFCFQSIRLLHEILLSVSCLLSFIFITLPVLHNTLVARKLDGTEDMLGGGGAFWKGAVLSLGRAQDKAGPLRGAAHLKGGGALGRGLKIICVGFSFVYKIGEVLFCGDC